MYNWKQVLEAKVGHIFVDRHKDGLRFIIRRGPCGLCAYVGIPESHPLAGHSYDDLPIECHGGLTFSSLGNNKYLPNNWWWYGWDYSHCNDYSTYYDKDNNLDEFHQKLKKWTVKDVDDDSRSAIYGFGKLMRLSEGIANRLSA